MCQRYVLAEQRSAEREFLPSSVWWNFKPRFNVSATQHVPAIRMHDGQSEGVMLRWGLIPGWLEGEPAGTPWVTAPLDRMESDAAYRLPWLNRQRCILPAAGYYTWHLTREGYRQPFFVRLAERSVFGIAALWDRHVGEDDDVVESCSIITVPPNELLEQISVPGRGMPAILRRRDYPTWLAGAPVAARAALQTYKAQWMRAHPVSPRINASDVDDAALIRIAC